MDTTDPTTRARTAARRVPRLLAVLALAAALVAIPAARPDGASARTAESAAAACGFLGGTATFWYADNSLGIHWVFPNNQWDMTCDAFWGWANLGCSGSEVGYTDTTEAYCNF